MTKFGKCLVLFAVAVSFAFLGTALVAWRGGPNWDAEVATLPGYTIQKTDELPPKWTVTDRDSGQSVTVSKPSIEAAAIVAAREDLAKKQKAETAKLNEETADYRKKLAECKKFNEADVKALEVRVQDMVRELGELDAKILSLSNDVVKKSQEAQAVRTEAAKRREDVYRLTRELDEIRADHFRADELQKKLKNQLVRLNGIVAELETRNKQLRSE